MTPNLEKFLTSLQATCDVPGYVDAVLKQDDGTEPSPAIIIPAQHERVGDLTICDDGNELTVVIGELHHTHFSPDTCDERSNEQRLSAAIAHTATFVAELLADRVLISVDYAGDRCLGSSHQSLDSSFTSADRLRTSLLSPLRKGTRRSLHYIWSGPIVSDG